MTGVLTNIAELVTANPWLVAFWCAAIVLTGVLGWSLRTPVMRNAFRKFAYLTRNAFSKDLGARDLFYWLFLGCCVAFPVALVRGYGKAGDRTFHWEEFVFVLIIVAVSNGARAVFIGLTAGGKILRPIHGRVWLIDRKIKTAAILQRVNTLLEDGDPPVQRVRELISDILDVIVSHVRDHRGNHEHVEVFANLLLIDGDDLVVVARDPNLTTSKDLKRTTPARYPRAVLAAGRAIEGRTVVSVGDYHLEYRELPKNKPYRSVLAIPLLKGSLETGPDGETQIVGALCIDSSRPYFFEAFKPGILENELENSLAPYTHLLILVLESLLSRDAGEMLSRLLRPHETVRPALDGGEKSVEIESIGGRR